METNIFSGSYSSVCSSPAVASHPHTSELTVLDVSPPRASQAPLHSSWRCTQNFMWRNSPVLPGAPSVDRVQGWCAPCHWGSLGKAIGYDMKKSGTEALRGSSARDGREEKGWPINKYISRNGEWVCIINDCKICLNMERRVATSQDGMEPGPQLLCPNTWMIMWFWKTPNDP